MSSLLRIADGLYRHDDSMHDARPDRERDQAAVLGGIVGRGDQVGTEYRIESADHLKVVMAMSAVPQPAGGPNETERVDGEKDCAEYHECNFKQLLAHA